MRLSTVSCSRETSRLWSENILIPCRHPPNPDTNPACGLSGNAQELLGLFHHTSSLWDRPWKLETVLNASVRAESVSCYCLCSRQHCKRCFSNCGYCRRKYLARAVVAVKMLPRERWICLPNFRWSSRILLGFSTTAAVSVYWDVKQLLVYCQRFLHCRGVSLCLGLLFALFDPQGKPRWHSGTVAQ